MFLLTKNNYWKYIFVPIFICIITGCHGKQKKFNGDDSLKYQADSLLYNTVWTQQLEKDRLLQDVSFINTVDKNIKLTPQVFINSSYSTTLKPLYPVIEGFGSTDLYEMIPPISSTVDSFCQNLINDVNSDSLMDSDSVWEYALFYSDFKRLMKDCFGTDLLTETKDDKKINFFKSYLIGSPEVTNQFFEVPVRISAGKKGYTDIVIYFYQEKDLWKINQLAIKKMERNDGNK